MNPQILEFPAILSTNPKSTVLVLSFSPLHRDPRVQRQILFLKNEFEVTAAGYTNPKIEGIDFIKMPIWNAGLWEKGFQAIRLKTGKFESYYWKHPSIKKAHALLIGKHWDLIIANDLFSLPFAIELAKPYDTKILVDAHEYEPLHFDDNWRFNFFKKKFWEYIASEYLPQADAMTTVCEGIATKYNQQFGISCSVINNATHFHSLEPTTIDAHCIRMIHHGICNPSRRLENMIELMERLDRRFSLDMMLVPDNRRYHKKLVSMADSLPSVIIREPVQMEDIVPTLTDYDIGLFLLSPKAFNYRMALPNKLFEFIQARLAVVVWPSPEMAKIVNQYGVGIVSEEFNLHSVAASLNKLTIADIQLFKKQSHAAAPILCAEQNKDQFLRIVRSLLNGNRR